MPLFRQVFGKQNRVIRTPETKNPIIPNIISGKPYSKPQYIIKPSKLNYSDTNNYKSQPYKKPLTFYELLMQFRNRLGIR